MKTKLFYSIIAASAVMMLTGCSQDDIVGTQTGGNTNVTFNVNTQDISTRSFGDGTTAKILSYAVYDKDGNLVQDLGTPAGKTAEFTDLHTSVTLNLVKGNTYTVVFWADAGTDSSPYNVDFRSKQLTYKTASMAANDEKRDAFYNTVQLTVTNDVNENVTLTRPFAQINIGTNDFAEANKTGEQIQYSRIILPKGMPNTMNLLDGTVSSTNNDYVRYNYAALPAEEFPVSDYHYLSMNYVLVGKDKTTTDISLYYSANANGTKNLQSKYVNVPIQRNYRTNIYGSLLTNAVNYNVTIEPNFYTTDHNINVVAQSELDQAVTTPGNTYTIPTGAEVEMPANIAEGVTIQGVEGSSSRIYIPTDYAVNNSNVTFKNVALTYDGASGASQVIKVTGNNTTFDNVTINQSSKSRSKTVSVADGVTATFKNCKVGSAQSQSNLVAIKAEGANSNIVLENCDFSENSGWSYNGSGTLTAKNCHFSGWLSGWNKGATFDNCTFGLSFIKTPAAICYGNTTFNNCKFYNVGYQAVYNPKTKDFDKNYHYYHWYNYMVSSGAAVDITFNNCKWVATTLVGAPDNVHLVEGATTDLTHDIYVRGMGDGKKSANKVIINGTEYSGDDHIFVGEWN